MRPTTPVFTPNPYTMEKETPTSPRKPSDAAISPTHIPGVEDTKEKLQDVPITPAVGGSDDRSMSFNDSRQSSFSDIKGKGKSVDFGNGYESRIASMSSQAPTLDPAGISEIRYKLVEAVGMIQDIQYKLEAAMGLREQLNVTWDGENDPTNPLNWTTGQKWTNVILIAMQTTLCSLASTIVAIGAGSIAKEFQLEDAFTPALPTALYVLGLGLGGLLLAPCSELYGRKVIYSICFSLFFFLNIACAESKNIGMLAVFRLLSGIMGSAGPSLGAGSIGDMFTRAERGRALAVYSFGPTGGPVLGGVIGGFIVYHTDGWRWLFWTIAIAAGVTNIISFIFLKETYSHTILKAKAKAVGGHYSIDDSVPPKELFTRAITRPLRILFTSPICAFMAIYLSVIFGILYLHLVTIVLLFGPEALYGLESYRWTHGTTGLAYLGAGSGAITGMLLTAKFMNRSYQWALKRREEKTGQTDPIPELRLPFLQVGMVIVPVGLIMFAWSAGRTHWAVPLVGACIFGIGMMMAYVCIHAYLVDCFNKYAASALAGVILARCTITCGFCLLSNKMYQSLGYAWGSMLLAFLCIAMMPVPFILKKYGPKMREKPFDF